MDLQQKIDLMVEYAKCYIKTPYIYGGNSFAGLDCSGFIQEVLASVGWDLSGDQSAQAIYSGLLWTGWTSGKLAKGSILFFGRSRESISHVALAIDDEHMIECGGGDQTTKTINDAVKRFACVRIRPIKNRRDFVESLYPKGD